MKSGRKSVESLQKLWDKCCSFHFYQWGKWGFITLKTQGFQSERHGSWTHVCASRLFPWLCCLSSPSSEEVARSSVSLWITWDGRSFVLWCLWADRTLPSFFFVSDGPPEGTESDRYSTLFFKNYLFIYLFWLCWVFIAVWAFPSICMSRGGYSLVVVLGLLMKVTSLVLEHGIQGVQSSVVLACGLSHCSPWALERRLNCPEAWGIFLDQGSNPCVLPWQADSLPLSHQEALVSAEFLYLYSELSI